MADFDVVTRKDVERSNRRFANTLNQKVDASLLNPRVGWTDPAQGGASGTRAPFDPAAQYELDGGGGSITIEGDLDMKQYDIINIDRLKFKSDDGLSATDTKAHISSVAAGISLRFFVPATSHAAFYVGSTSSAFDVSDTWVRAYKPLRTSRYIVLDPTSTTPTLDGSVWHVSSKLKVRLGGNTRDILTSSADIDLDTHDINDVDRIFFRSNDILRTNYTKSYIGANARTQTSRPAEDLVFFVPPLKIQHFYSGPVQLLSLSSAHARFQTQIECTEFIKSEKQIRVGILDGTAGDGMIWYEANKLKARINGATVNLGEGTTTPTVPEPTVATGAFWLPIQTYSASSISGVTNADLDTAFGAQQGSIGVLKPASNFSAGAYGLTFLVFKGRHGATSTSNSRKWFYIPFTGRRSSTIASTGLRDNALDYSRQRQAPQANHAASVPTNNILGSQRGVGKWGIYYQNTEWDEASLFVYTTATTLMYREKTDELSSGSVFSGDVSLLPSTIKTVTGNPDNAGLDTAFGADDGSCGVRLGSDDWFYVKVGGYWFYIDLTTSGTGP